MTTDITDTTGDIPCHRCGYDLRAHPPDGTCPECGASVAEARKLAAIPRRPPWRDSDPRWRRRVLAGVWVLVLLPLVDVSLFYGWAARVHVPGILGSPDVLDTLDNTFLLSMRLDLPLLFCIGVALLFAKERGRLRGRLDWTRRWGVLCSYVVALLSAVPVLNVTAFVLVGMGALFMSMPRRYQPGVTQRLVDVGGAYLRHAPQATQSVYGVLVVFSSAAVVLACAPLYEALRSTGLRRIAQVLLTPLVFFALLNLVQAGRYFAGAASVPLGRIGDYEWYFQPNLLVTRASRLPDLSEWATLPPAFFVEVAKWCIMLAIAVGLTAARWVARRRGERS